MTTTRDDIHQWIKHAPKGTTHMIVACDTFEWGDFPVYVRTDQDVHVIAAEHEKVMGVYNLRANIERQIAADRTFNFD